MLKRREMILAVAIAIAGSCVLTAAALAQASVDLAKAKAEGKVVWYTSTPLPQAQKIVNLFEKEYGIKVELFRSGGSAILRRFQQEADAGRIAADVLTTVRSRGGGHADVQGHVRRVQAEKLRQD